MARKYIMLMCKVKVKGIDKKGDNIGIRWAWDLVLNWSLVHKHIRCSYFHDFCQLRFEEGLEEEKFLVLISSFSSLVWLTFGSRRYCQIFDRAFDLQQHRL